MKKSFLFVIIMLSSLPFAEAQQSRDRFDISAEVNNRNQVVFRAKRLDNVIFTAVLDIHGTQNLRLAGKFQRFNVRSDGTILTIEPLNPNQSVRYQFGYRYFIGSVSPRKIDRQHIYRLPFGVSASREARNLYNVYDRHFGGDKHSVDFKAFQFIMNRADTVYAARKGMVIEVTDEHDPIIGMGEVGMNTENNEVTVEHADGTVARYGVLERGSIAVKLGQTVYPDTPIALAGTLDGEIYQTRFSLYYRTDNLNNINDLSEYSLTYHGLDPVFATSEGETTLTANTTYTPVVSEELVTGEMTKREIRDR